GGVRGARRGPGPQDGLRRRSRAEHGWHGRVHAGGVAGRGHARAHHAHDRRADVRGDRARGRAVPGRPLRRSHAHGRGPQGHRIQRSLRRSGVPGARGHAGGRPAAAARRRGARRAVARPRADQARRGLCRRRVRWVSGAPSDRRADRRDRRGRARARRRRLPCRYGDARRPVGDGGRPRARRDGDGGERARGHRARVRGRLAHPVRRHALSQGHRAAPGRAGRRTPRGASMTNPIRVGIVLGSDTDLDVMLEAVKVLDALAVGSEVVVASAHRTPKKTEEYASTAEARGLGVLIAAAGGAAALPGVLAASSALPVIGVPIAATPLAGMDALLSIVQMPKGVPVATVAIGSWGAVNAAILAAQILAVGDAALRRRLAAYRATLAAEVEDRARRVAAELMARHWPGALTLVLRAAAGVPAELTSGTGTVGVRLPAHATARALVRALGAPVTAPSANPTGAEPPTTAGAVLAHFGDALDLVLDGGPTPGGAASTVVDVTVDPPRVIRQGAITLGS